MIAYRLKIKTILTVSAIISIIIFSLVLLLNKIANFKELLEILAHYGAIVLPISGLWFAIENKLWYMRWLQNFKSIINIPPDFRGRWEGTIDRDDENDPHSFVFEIKQTLSRIQVCTYSNRSKSQSIFAEITTDEFEDKFNLCFLWQGNAAAIEKKSIPKGVFYGYSIMELFEKNEPKKLVGEYFTDRSPTQTKGKIELTWVSFELKGRFN